MEKNAGLGLERTGFTAHCTHCRREEVFIHARLANRRHLIVSILTGGIWAVVWTALFIGKCLRPWRCQACGWHKPEFRKTVSIPVPVSVPAALQPAGPFGLSAKKVQPPTVE